ncbi:MAG: 7-dehydrocholesterol reductase [Verrucomicrobiota bacterium]|nr:7-dehydrocholesterol reductase [Verrucomicrobiota bacterium]
MTEETPSRVPQWIHKTLVPLFLLTFCPPTVFIFWYINTSLGGSFTAFWDLVQTNGLFPTLINIWKPVFFGSPTAWKILACYSIFQLLLMRFVPGKPFLGPVTPKGNIPIYKANGFSCYLISLVTFCLGSYAFHWFSPTIIYDNMGPMLGALNLFSLFFCFFLYLKGRFKPSTTDHGISGNPFFDYYWGTELYPRLFGWDIKQFTNCRFGMMGWSLILFSYAAKQQQLYGLSDSMIVAVALQFIYISKFFLWETGYLRSLDIMHDRAGFYICWGCLVWLPCIYTSPTLYLVHNPNHLGTYLASGIFLAGAASIIVNYLADRQRQVVRAKNGNCFVWRRRPHIIPAIYTTHNGETKRSLLLASGWWGIARHFHYIPEILGSFFWSMPALFTHFIPYFYVAYLTLLLLDRAFRHDQRCADKYGPSWDQYCERVPYKIIPFVF